MGRLRDIFNEPAHQHPYLLAWAGFFLGVCIDAALLVIIFTILLR